MQPFLYQSLLARLHIVYGGGVRLVSVVGVCLCLSSVTLPAGGRAGSQARGRSGACTVRRPTTQYIVFTTCCILNVTNLSLVAFGVLADYPNIFAKTNKFKNSFICVCLSNIQTK